MSEMSPNKQLANDLAVCQNRLFYFILSLIGNVDQAEDVLQETNRVILENFEQYVEIKNFQAWAMKIAFNQVRTHRKRVQRDRLSFSDDFLAQVADQIIQDTQRMDRRQQALDECLEKLNPKHLNLLKQRYAEGLEPRRIAQLLGRSVSAINVALFRIRSALRKCIEKVQAAS